MAVAVERAGVGVVALLADRDRRRLGCVEHGEHLGDQSGDQGEVGAGVGGHVLGDEEPLEVVVLAFVDIRVVEVHQEARGESAGRRPPAPTSAQRRR